MYRFVPSLEPSQAANTAPIHASLGWVVLQQYRVSYGEEHGQVQGVRAHRRPQTVQPRRPSPPPNPHHQPLAIRTSFPLASLLLVHTVFMLRGVAIEWDGERRTTVASPPPLPSLRSAHPPPHFLTPPKSAVPTARARVCVQNARLVVQTRVPAILNDSLWFSCQHGDIFTNIASLSFGLAFMDYPLAWWVYTINSLVRKWRVQGIISLKAIRQWAVRGSAYRLEKEPEARDV